MQMSKAILRNGEIVIFDQKKFCSRPGEFPTRWIRDTFFHVGLIADEIFSQLKKMPVDICNLSDFSKLILRFL